MDNYLKQSKRGPTPWLRKLERYLALGQKARALLLLEKVIGSDMPLFWDDPAIQEERRFAWLCRIDLLREWGRLSEALAWTCLECELNPGNVEAQALKERLKKSLHLRFKIAEELRKAPQREPIEGLWSGVAGMREVKAILERDVILPLQEPELYKQYRIDLPNGIMFYGPPGCGKTYIARKIAEILKFQFLEIKPSDIASIYVHGGQKEIQQLFNEARNNAPALLFFDEIDALLPKRSDNKVGHHYKAEVNEFLAQLDKSWELGVFVLGATNLIENLDPAVLRPGRMDKKVFIGPPDFEARVELLKLYMQDRPQEAIDWLRIADKTEFCTAAELEHIVNEAARYALYKDSPISEKDLLDALNKNPPILNREKIKKIKAPIGFV